VGNFLATYPRLRFEYEKTIDHTFVDMVNRAIAFDQQYQDSSDAKRDSVYYYQGVNLFNYMFKHGFPNFYLNRENVNANRLMGMLRHFFICLRFWRMIPIYLLPSHILIWLL
jgi:hypothetical protein